uniref:Uncharacterized protein n=1 Tax=Anguilla anguilla TaxID=7936 RepID=A0A0E9RES3_ANGAN
MTYLSAPEVLPNYQKLVNTQRRLSRETAVHYLSLTQQGFVS